MLLKGTLGIAILAVAQAPVRLLASVLVLRRSRRLRPDLFDGRVCAAAVAACVEEYQRTLSCTEEHLPSPRAIETARRANGACGPSGRDRPDRSRQVRRGR
jgi:hypothetical protein